MNFVIDKYLSGYFALNLPAPEGTTGDWHSHVGADIPDSAWHGEEYPEKNTLDSLGLYGLWDAEIWLKAKGFPINGACFAANHFRAVLDIAHTAGYMGWRNINKMISEEFFDQPWQKKEVLVQAIKMARFYKNDTIWAWVEFEASHSYAFEEEGIFKISDLEKEADKLEPKKNDGAGIKFV